MRDLFGYEVLAGAEFSPCRTWRYTLTRTWDQDRPVIAYVGLNPSYANEKRLDRTTQKCVKWAERDGYGKYVMLNLFGFVSTLPEGLLTAPDRVGPENDEWIAKTFAEASTVVFCWGATLSKLTADRIEIVRKLADEAGLNPLCPGHTKEGFPLHPCRLENATRMILYNARRIENGSGDGNVRGAGDKTAMGR